MEDSRAVPYQADLALSIGQEELSSERWKAEVAHRTLMKSVLPRGAQSVAATVNLVSKRESQGHPPGFSQICLKSLELQEHRLNSEGDAHPDLN